MIGVHEPDLDPRLCPVQGRLPGRECLAAPGPAFRSGRSPAAAARRKRQNPPRPVTAPDRHSSLGGDRLETSLCEPGLRAQAGAVRPPGRIGSSHGVDSGSSGSPESRSAAPTEPNPRSRADPGVRLRSPSCGPVRLGGSPDAAGAERSQSGAPSEANRRRRTKPIPRRRAKPNPPLSAPVHNGAAPCGMASHETMRTWTVALFGAPGPSRAPGGPTGRARDRSQFPAPSEPTSRRRAKPIFLRRAKPNRRRRAKPIVRLRVAAIRPRAGRGRGVRPRYRPRPTCQRTPVIIVNRRRFVLRIRGRARRRSAARTADRPGHPEAKGRPRGIAARAGGGFGISFAS